MTRIAKSIISFLLMALIVFTLPSCAKNAENKSTKNHVNVGLIDGIYYGMTPENTMKVLGEPKCIEDKMALTSKVGYQYIIEIDNTQVEFLLYYINDKALIELHGHLIADSIPQAKNIFNNWVEKLQNEYKEKDGYYFHEKNGDTEQTMECELGFIKGAIGLDCVIQLDGCEVKVACIYQD